MNVLVFHHYVGVSPLLTSAEVNVSISVFVYRVLIKKMNKVRKSIRYQVSEWNKINQKNVKKEHIFTLFSL